jgi:hypothetical protein
MPFLPKRRYEVVEVVPGANDLLSWTEEAHPLLEIGQF